MGLRDKVEIAAPSARNDVIARSGATKQSILLPYQKRWVDDKSPLKIWLASRQVGKSFCLSMEAVTEALEKKCNNLILSASERQSKEVMLKVYAHLRYLNCISEDTIKAEAETKEEATLPNGSRIISLPASPDTVRGFSGNVFLDEFAFHKDDEAIWRAMYPTITRGFKLRISSTPNGKQNMFYKLWEIASPSARNDVIARSEATRQSRVWVRHRTDIFDAVSEGLDVDIAALREGIGDPEAWAQEFECRFMDEATAFITYEMIESCEEDTLSLALPPQGGGGNINSPQGGEGNINSPQGGIQKIPSLEGRDIGRVNGEFFLGVDIGRRHDLTVFYLLEKIGDVLWTRLIKEMRGEPFRVQRECLFNLMNDEIASAPLRNDVIASDRRKRGNLIQRACIDSTGLGIQLAEEAVERFGGRIEPVTFTAPVKEDLAITLRRKFEDRLIRIPSDKSLREDLHSVRRSTTSSGNFRFDAGRTEEGGHADRFWALALAVHAAEAPGRLSVQYESLAARNLLIDIPNLKFKGAW